MGSLGLFSLVELLELERLNMRFDQIAFEYVADISMTWKG